MHEFRKFIQRELDARGWKQADLARRSGLSRSHVSKLLRDDRQYLGQMPDEETIRALADGFALTEEVVRTAASRALAGFSDDGGPLQIELADVPTDALLEEVRRRIDTTIEPAPAKAAGQAHPAMITATKGGDHDAQEQKSWTQEGSKKHGSAGGDKEGRTPSIGAAADPRHLNPVPNQPTTEQLAELERVREDYKHPTKPTEWRLNDHGEVVDRSGVPPFREELEEAACTVPDELAGMMPEDSDLEPDPDGPEYGA
ncbi:helix-turn-helix domain-containing protein [Rhodococcus jostii]|uniref:helix-turn-helix domain-containing protein n=1 Tax=Rhodococcus jostii TaxID=132919 RepID=UPI00363E6EEA